jgi:hypothetical protein
MPSRWGLSSDVSRTRCLPPPSAGGREERRDQNHVARRATSVNTEEGIVEDSRCLFQRCRSAISHRLRFYREPKVRDRCGRRQARTSCTRRVSASSSVVGGYASVFLGESGQWDNSSVAPFARSLAFPLPCCERSVVLTPGASSSSSLWYHGAFPPRSCSSGEGGSDCKRTGEELCLGERTRDMRG